jgi:glucose-6-phosphate 1-dehydrogenase
MDMVEAGWEAIEPILRRWAQDPGDPVPEYAAGSMGPSEADVLVERNGRQWQD